MANTTAATLSPEEDFNNKKLFSDKIHARVQKVSNEISKALDDLKIGTDEEKRLFLNAVNHYYNDLCAVIFHLRQTVIQIDCDDQGVRDLQNVITELNKIVVLVQDCLNVGTEKLIIQLKGTIAHVGSQIEKLVEVVKYDNLHEHKQKILDTQHDLVLAVEALKLHCLACYLNPSELGKIGQDIIDKIINNLSQIKTGHEHLVGDFSHYTRHSVQISRNVINYMQKMVNTKNFQGDMANCFKAVVERYMDFYKEYVEAADSDNIIENMLQVFKNKKQQVSDSTDNLKKTFQVVMEKGVTKQEIEPGKQLMIYMYIYGIIALSAMNQSIEDAIMKI